MNTSRRKFIESTVKASIVGSLLPVLGSAKNLSVNENPLTAAGFEFSQIKLPYEYAALEPSIDAMTMEIHYTKHHAAYIKNVNEALAADKIVLKDEKEFFAKVAGLSDKIKNNGGGAWNHNFFWQVMKPNGGGAPSGKIGDAVNASFGSFDKFKEQFTQAAMTRFGSGWAWLVSDNGKLTIGSTPNQDNPLMANSAFKGTPILGIDVWEHAYYLKYQNKRIEYVTNWFNVVNWDEVAKRLV